jgi:PTH1 family peptidyl-tRNA hydrolase
VKLIVGLGNPGAEYERTRHNVGFDVIDRLARRYADPAAGAAKARFSGLTLEGQIGSEKVLLLKPLTYMNLSGNAVGEAIRFYKLQPEADLLVIVDDIALACGVIRLRCEGSAGGHNGLGDIERKLATSNYPRLRIGVDNPGAIPQKSYVLGKFRPDQLERLEPALNEAVDAAACWAINGIAEAMNRFNRKNTA